MNGFELILPFLRPIQDLILDPDISEIMVNGPERIFIEKAGHLQAVPGVKLTPESLTVAVKNIARRLGDDISEAKPILDSRLPDGSRVAAVIPPCSIHGVALTIRKFNSHRFRMKDLVEVGTLTAKLAAQLEDYVAQRKNLLICGGTSSGKTTLANALVEFIPDHERIVLIEDTAEIQIQKENVLRFEARREQNGLPAVTIRDLLKATLRHRPDRIIVGEIRGGEAFDLLQLLNRTCKLRRPGHFAVHNLCVAKRRRNALPRRQDEYRRLAKRHNSDRASAWDAIRLRSCRNPRIRSAIRQFRSP